MLTPTYLDYRQNQVMGDDGLGEIKTRQEFPSISQAKTRMVDEIIKSVEQAGGVNVFVRVEPLRAMAKSVDGYVEDWTIRFKKQEDQRAARLGLTAQEETNGEDYNG